MSQNQDDLDAVRMIVKALEPFEPKDQERIIRWAREKAGLLANVSPLEQGSAVSTKNEQTITATEPRKVYPSIRDFIKSKNPQTAIQLAATVAYYYRFEAPETDKKETIDKNDLREACRQADMSRLDRPEQTLVHAFHAGLLNKGQERGTYVINSVGENLVAMTLPASKPTAKKAIKRSTKPTVKKAAMHSKK